MYTFGPIFLFNFKGFDEFEEKNCKIQKANLLNALADCVCAKNGLALHVSHKLFLVAGI